MAENQKMEIDTSMLSDTLISAIELAGKLIEWDKSKSIMISYIEGKCLLIEETFLNKLTK